jgi:hypothetical protein
MRRAIPGPVRSTTPIRASLVGRSHSRSKTVLTYRVVGALYRVEIRGAGTTAYAVIHSASHLPSPSLAVQALQAVTTAIAQVLSSLARTGGGGFGRLAAMTRGIQPLVLVGLILLGLGVLTRRLSPVAERQAP